MFAFTQQKNLFLYAHNRKNDRKRNVCVYTTEKKKNNIKKHTHTHTHKSKITACTYFERASHKSVRP